MTDAGLEIIEARITYLAYAPEIAAVMLQRQQASAIIDARKMIVDGAVGMVEMALDQLSEKDGEEPVSFYYLFQSFLVQASGINDWLCVMVSTQNNK